APPVLVTVRATVKIWPRLANDGASADAARTPGVCTAMAAVSDEPEETAAPELASSPSAVEENRTEPDEEAVNVQVNVIDVPATSATGAGGYGPAEYIAPPVPMIVGSTGVTPVAA